MHTKNLRLIMQCSSRYFYFLLLFVVSFSTPAAAIEKDDTVYEVVIVGGGMAGMTAAYYLREYDIKVLEKRQNVGGRSFSLPHKEFVFACGAEYLGKLYGPLKKITKKLKLKVREIPYPMDVHFEKGKFYYGEMGRALLAADKVSLKEFRRFGYAVQKFNRKYEDVPDLKLDSKIAQLDDITARQWFVQNNFSDFFSGKYNVTFKGLFGANTDEISALSALVEIGFDFEKVNMIEEFSNINELENDPTPGKYHTGAYSFDHGIAEIPLALAAYLGEKVEVNANVTHVEKKGDVFFITYLGKDNKKYTVKSETIILATPAPISLDIGKNILSAEQKKILTQVEYAPFITLALFSSTPIFNQGFDLAVPDGMFFTDVYDATWIPRYYNKALKGLNTFIATIYIASKSYKDTSILFMSDTEIIKNVYKDLEKIFPGVQQKVTGYRIFRFQYGYPVMTLGAYKRLSRLHKITNGSIGLAGDYTIYPTLEAAADSGELSAEKILEWLEEDE